MKHSNELSAAGVAPVIISFSELKFVKEWLNQTKCTFPAFVDPKRTTYASFGLPRSVNVFMLDTMKFYGEAIAKQENLPQIDVQEDVIQLGGDFTIEKVSKKMVFLYPSKTSADRPTLEMILEAVEK